MLAEANSLDALTGAAGMTVIQFPTSVQPPADTQPSNSHKMDSETLKKGATALPPLPSKALALADMQAHIDLAVNIAGAKAVKVFLEQNIAMVECILLMEGGD